MKYEISEVRAELEALRQLAVISQGPMIKASLYKLVRTQAFGEYVNACADALNPAAATDAIELVSMDYLELDIKKAMYGYNEKGCMAAD